MGTWVTKEMHLGTLFICKRAGKSIKSMLERGHTEAFFKWQLSRARKYLLRVHRRLGEATGRGRREISTDPSGKRPPISRRVELHEDSQWRVGHIQEVTPERTSRGSESRVGAGLVPQGGAGAAGGPAVTQGPGRAESHAWTCRPPPPACGFQGACRPAHWRPRGLCAPSWSGCRGWQLPERSPPSLSGLGLWKKGLRPGRTGGAALQRP